MSGQSSSSSVPKAIGSLAKKQSDVTRQGTQKLKFVPTLPQRRKKEDVKQEPVTPTPPSPTKPGRGRGTGRGENRGVPRGRGRGILPAAEMTASGPFAMGPSQAGRSTDRSSFATVDPLHLNIGLSQTGPPSLGKDGKHGKGKEVKVEDEELYSDPDEGVEIVDMDQIQKIDWMAPDILRQIRSGNDTKMKQEGLDNIAAEEGDLSESEGEELEVLIDNFAAKANFEAGSLREHQLYFFQFPSPFPTFIKNDAMDVDQPRPPTEKKVTFAPDVRSDASSSRAASTSGVPETTEPKKSEHVSGAIGQLEVYRSGAVKMRLANDILLDVNGSTQPSFLQHVVHLDKAEKQLVVLGEVNKHFVVSPNVEALLSALDKLTEKNTDLQDENLIKLE